MPLSVRWGSNLRRRAQTLRAFFAELERLRHHMTSIREICASTSLTVAANQALWLEERFLRISGETRRPSLSFRRACNRRIDGRLLRCGLTESSRGPRRCRPRSTLCAMRWRIRAVSSIASSASASSANSGSGVRTRRAVRTSQRRSRRYAAIQPYERLRETRISTCRPKKKAMATRVCASYSRR